MTPTAEPLLMEAAPIPIDRHTHFDALVRDYGQAVFRYLVGMLGDEQAAESRRFEVPVADSIPLSEAMPRTIQVTVKVLPEDLLSAEQQWVIAVRVTDPDGVPIPGASVSVVESPLYATSLPEEQESSTAAMEPWRFATADGAGMARILLSWPEMVDLLNTIEAREPPLRPSEHFDGLLFAYLMTGEGMQSASVDFRIPIGPGPEPGAIARSWPAEALPEAWRRAAEQRVTLLEVTLPGLERSVRP